jgi:hypothetical protein
MGYAVKIYEAFKDDEIKAKLLSEFIELVEQAILNNQLATRQDVTLSELKLTREIEQVRADVTEKINDVTMSTIRLIVPLFTTQTITILGIIAGLFQVMK